MVNQRLKRIRKFCRSWSWPFQVKRLHFASYFIAVIIMFAANHSFAADQDPLLNLLLQKGILTEDEAKKVQAELDVGKTNALQMPPPESKWKINNAIKNIELYGDLRLRYEYRRADVPDGDVELQRGRYSVRIGLRGEAFEDIYYGVRLDTAPNPRSPWVTFGTSSSGVPYQGPYGKSTAGINVGQVFIGYRPAEWVDITLGKMQQPLYTTPMVWDSDFSPEGAAERFKHKVGNVTFFANFGQFLYQDVNPDEATGGLGFNGLQGTEGNAIFQFAWQGGIDWHFTTNLSAKVAATFYHYAGLQQSSQTQPGPSPFFGDVFIGEGAFTGANSPVANGASGLNLGGTSTQGSIAYPSFGYPLNQVGLRNLEVLEFPFEVNYRMKKLNWRLFGDFSYNLQGSKRAEEAAQGYAAFVSNPSFFNSALPLTSTLKPFTAQTKDVKAYQIGLGVGTAGLDYGPAQGLVYENVSKKHAWEVRAYWQHVEQYALDPNLLDSDFFEGRGNLEGIYTALAYSLTDNTIATLRYGYANRINDQLGTGGANQDIPQVNPITHYSILQVDLTFRF
jgi:hypothetical protein